MTTITLPKRLRDRLTELRTHRHQPLYEVIERLLETRTQSAECVVDDIEEIVQLARDLVRIPPRRRLEMLLERLEFMREKTGTTLKELQERLEWGERVSARL